MEGSATVVVALSLHRVSGHCSEEGSIMAVRIGINGFGQLFSADFNGDAHSAIVDLPSSVPV
jgi:hypothetical protein